MNKRVLILGFGMFLAGCGVKKTAEPSNNINTYKQEEIINRTNNESKPIVRPTIILDESFIPKKASNSGVVK